MTNQIDPQQFLATPPLNAMLQNFKLEQMLEVLGTQHQLKVAKRFSKDSTIKSKAEAERQLQLTLNEPKNVDALIARLHPTELAILQELRRYGGVASGWALYVYARLHGLSPPPQSMSIDSNYLFHDYSPANYSGASFIWSLLADGLLFPVKVPNPWLGRSAYSFYRQQWELFPGAPSNLVLADPRLLSRLPLVPRPLAPLPTPVATGTPAPGSAAVLSARLRISEVLRVLERHGGLALTKSREPSQNALKKLHKELDALQDPAMWLEIVMGLGLIIPDSKGEKLVAYRQGWQELSRMTPREFAGLMLNILPSLDRPEDTEHRLANPVTLRACLLELLKELGGPVRESEFKKLAEGVIPGEVRASRAYDYYGRERREQVGQWDLWLSKTLRGLLVEFGWLYVQENPADQGDAVLIPSPILRGEVAGNAANGPAWVLQPNFELLVYPEHLQAAQLPLLAAAEAVRFDAQTATYRLTRESVYHALEGGLTLEQLLTGLAGASATPLSPAMRRTMQDWAARRERLVLHQGATLLEFPTAADRDTALPTGGVAVGETFVLLLPGQKIPVGTNVLKYDAPPAQALKVSDSGEFVLSGPLDLMGRALLAGRVEQAGPGQYRFVPPQSGSGQYPRNLIVDLDARTTGRLPDALRVQLSVWTGLTPAPTLANLTILQHPQAQMLAKHPALKPLLGPSLSPTLLTIQAGQEQAFRATLERLGLGPKQELRLETAASTDLVVIEDTRKKRTFIEEAMKNGHNLLIHYHEEKESYGGWYGTRVSQGKLRKETVRPESIDRRGSTPYLWAQVLDSSDNVRIRIAYITGMAIR